MHINFHLSFYKRFAECFLFLSGLKQLFLSSSRSIFFLCRFFEVTSPFLHPYIQTGWINVLLWRRKSSLLFFTFNLFETKSSLPFFITCSLKISKNTLQRKKGMNKRPYDWTLHIADLYLAFNERSY